MAFLPSPCVLCSASCCRNPHITVTAFDVLRIAGRTGKGPESFASLYPLRLLNFDNETVLECHESPGPRLMGEHILCINSHPCTFLDAKNNLCTIHEFAPSVCRAFPKGIDGRMKTRLCPGVAGFMFRARCSVPGAPGFGVEIRPTYGWELATYKEIVTEWNRGRGKKADCMAFILRRAEEEMKNAPPSPKI